MEPCLSTVHRSVSESVPSPSRRSWPSPGAGAPVQLTEESRAAIARSRATVEELAAAPTPAYGISTGFGALATRHIPTEMRAQLQRSLIRSHAAGSGPAVEREVVRGLMLLRLSTLATGRTGVRPEVAELMAAVLNAGITPVVHEYGSLGCSGDLAPLSHCALALIGEGEVHDADGVLMPAAEALAAAGLAPGRAGRQGGPGPDQRHRRDARDAGDGADRPLRAAAYGGHRRRHVGGGAARHRPGLRPRAAGDPPAPRARPCRPPTSPRSSKDSGVVASHRGPDCNRVQDAYSLRCSPQVHGAARDTLDHCATVAGRELASAVDNPVVLEDGRVESNGNFHGAPVAYVLDFAAIVAADVASISERRTDRFLDRTRSHGLPPFLAHDPGRGQRPHDRAVHAGGDRLGAQAPREPGERRLDPLQRDAGGPRVDGLVGRSQAARARSTDSPG